MAHGPAPKDPDQRRRRNKTVAITVPADDELRGSDLPDGIDWPAQTRQWWHSWRRAAIAATFQATDWDYLLDTALLHASYWIGDASLAAEIRLRVAKFGATPEDRHRLGLKVETPKEPSVSADTPKKEKPNLRVVL